MTIYVKKDGLWQLEAAHENAALQAGCISVAFGERFNPGHVLLAHHTVGWVGVYRLQSPGKFPVLIKRFRDFGRALRCAQREDRALSGALGSQQ